jgi:hypothetical protein
LRNLQGISSRLAIALVCSSALRCLWCLYVSRTKAGSTHCCRSSPHSHPDVLLHLRLSLCAFRCAPSICCNSHRDDMTSSQISPAKEAAKERIPLAKADHKECPVKESMASQEITNIQCSNTFQLRAKTLALLGGVHQSLGRLLSRLHIQSVSSEDNCPMWEHGF